MSNKHCWNEHKIQHLAGDVAQINPRYCAQLQQVLTWPQSTGIVGGRPSSSLYFIGFQDQHVLYLDPHEVQEVRRSFYVCLSDKGGHARSHDNLHIVRHLWQQTVCPQMQLPA